LFLRSADAFNFLNFRRFISDVLQPPGVGFGLATSFVLHHLVSTAISVSLNIAVVILLFF
jgi:hypothetical protein